MWSLLNPLNSQCVSDLLCLTCCAPVFTWCFGISLFFCNFYIFCLFFVCSFCFLLNTKYKLSRIFVRHSGSEPQPVDQFTITLFWKKTAYNRVGKIVMVTTANWGRVVMVTERVSTWGAFMKLQRRHVSEHMQSDTDESEKRFQLQWSCNTSLQSGVCGCVRHHRQPTHM